MTTDPRSSVRVKNELPTILACNECDVTWREQPGSPCWLCGEEGYVQRPERLVLD